MASLTLRECPVRAASRLPLRSPGQVSQKTMLSDADEDEFCVLLDRQSPTLEGRFCARVPRRCNRPLSTLGDTAGWSRYHHRFPQSQLRRDHTRPNGEDERPALARSHRLLVAGCGESLPPHPKSAADLELSATPPQPRPRGRPSACLRRRTLPGAQRRRALLCHAQAVPRRRHPLGKRDFMD
jgi:hypothetical protein